MSKGGNLGWEAWLTVGVIGVMVFALMRNVAGPDIILLAGLGVLISFGLVSEELPSPTEAVRGFGNDGLVTVGLLFVVATGLGQTGAMSALTHPLLGNPAGAFTAQLRMMLPVAGLSAFLNNTPVVAVFMPVISEWARKTGITVSKLFIPLSYASILGGICTVIGTSTNLVVNGMLIGDPDLEGLRMFELAWVGLPCAAIGLTYILLTSRWLLPERLPAISRTHDPRKYTVEMVVRPRGPLVGKTIEEAGLRRLPALYLAEIDRDDQVLPAVSPHEMLLDGDRLVFVGAVESLADLQKLRGLEPATDQVFKLDAPRSERLLVEAVVSDTCPIVGRTIREGRFRARYGAVAIAVARGGRRLRDVKIGDVVLQPGDTLLLEAGSTFLERQRYSRDFFLVSPIEGSSPPRHERASAAVAIMAVMVVLVGVGWLSMLHGALLAAVAMIAAGCCTGGEARRGVDWTVLVTIGAAIGIGQSVQASGLAGYVATELIEWAGQNPILLLLVIYLITTVFTELITNNAAALIVFPIAQATALETGLAVTPFAVVIMIAASASFSTPLGYQTNLMVYGPGGYRFADYLRFGLPLNLIMLVVTVSIVPLVWAL